MKQTYNNKQTAVKTFPIILWMLEIKSIYFQKWTGT